MRVAVVVNDEEVHRRVAVHVRDEGQHLAGAKIFPPLNHMIVDHDEADVSNIVHVPAYCRCNHFIFCLLGLGVMGRDGRIDLYRL